MSKFAVHSMVGSKWENIWTETVGDMVVPLEFDSQELANQALDDFKKERLDAGLDFNEHHYVVAEILSARHKMKP